MRRAQIKRKQNLSIQNDGKGQSNQKAHILLMGMQNAISHPVIIQSLSHVRLCDPMNCSMPGLSITISWSLLKLISIEQVMPSNHLIFCHPHLFLPSLFPSIRVFSNESALQSGDQSLGASASVSVLLMNIQD